MTDNTPHCFYHPTKVVFVDDEIEQLQALTVRYPQPMVHLFESPVTALDYLNAPIHPIPLHQRFGPFIRSGMTPAEMQRTEKFGDKAFEMEVTNTQRFDQVAVVIVDYDMPEMDGIAFCKQLENPYIKKILLTGVGDESLAIYAFNAGIIDQFISKQQCTAPTQLHNAIKTLQQNYFAQISSFIENSMEYSYPHYLKENGFQQFFKQLCNEQNIIEYYLASQPNGFLLVNAEGRLSRLILLIAEELEHHQRRAVQQNAPQALIEQLQNKSVIPYFWKHYGGYYCKDCTAWETDLYPANTFHGDEPYYYTMIDNPPGYEKFINEVQSYSVHLSSCNAP